MEQYKDAALRHFEDALILKNENKFDNAGHLVGFAAECAIKHAISTLGNSQSSPHGHFPDFLNIARKHIKQRTPLFEFLRTPDLLSGWTVERRYYANGNTNEAELTAWVAQTKRLIGVVGIKVSK
jgi:hypothetical protein